MSKPSEEEADQGTVIRPVGLRRAGAPAAAPQSLEWMLTTQNIARQAPGNALQLGTRLGEFELTRVIGEGGFGIVYEAHDLSLERRVAVKEYFPADLAERIGDMQVRSLSEDDEATYRKGLQSFINEAKILARFDNPSLLKVYRFWEANATAYMVMPCYEGPTLHEALRRLRRPPDEDWLRHLLDPLTEALAVMHDESVYHRDIAPDNIVLLAGSGRPLLLDFGAARHVIQDAHQKSPTAIVKPGYAPIEQYSDVNLRQGPWSDVYALAAVMHLAITGKKPPAAVARLAGDAYVPLATRAADRYSPALLAAIDRALIVRPEQRTQNMDALRAELGFRPLPRDAGGKLLPGGSALASAGAGPGPVDEEATQFKRQMVAKPQSPAARPALAPSPAVDAAGGPDRLPWLLGGFVSLALLAGGGAWWFLGHEPASPGVPQPQASVAAEPTTAAPPVPQTAPAPALDPAPAPAPASPPPLAAREAGRTLPETIPVAPPAALQAFSVVDEFARIQARSSSAASVAVRWKSRSTFRIKDQDLLAMNITTTQDGYLYVLAHTPDNILFQYFPNQLSQANFIRRQQLTTVPRTVTDPRTRLVHEGIVLTDPPGTGHVLVIVSKYPRDFSLLGNRREAIYPVYPVGAQAQLLDLQLGGAESIYLGKPKCPRGQACADQFWAATERFEIVP